MKISTILDLIDSGQITLPKFQRSYVWSREQVRGFFHSLYRRHPVGSLLVWVTEANAAEYRGKGSIVTGTVNLLIDGQQRVTSLYGVVRGCPPEFFDGRESSFTGLWFHLEDEIFRFYTARMKNDSLWIDVTKLMREGIGVFMNQINDRSDPPEKKSAYLDRLNQLFRISEIDLYEEKITGEDKTLDIVVDIFSRVNSGGTKLSGGDLALAKVCAEWPDARDAMKARLRKWQEASYDRFTLEWLLRSVNTVLNGTARFSYLEGRNMQDLQNGLNRATKHIDICLNMIAGRLGLDHGQVLFGRLAIPVMVYYLEQRQKMLDAQERDKLLFWFVQVGMRGSFSGTAETKIDQELAILEDSGSIDALLAKLKSEKIDLRIKPDDFVAGSTGSTFYAVLYMLTRMGNARDLGNGLPLRDNLLGNMSDLERHHLFPQSQLHGRYDKKEINQLANYCFITKGTNLAIGKRLPEEYFAEIEQRHPGALASQWIPNDTNLWTIENYIAFLEGRRTLLAKEANRQLESLLHGDTQWLVPAV